MKSWYANRWTCCARQCRLLASGPRSTPPCADSWAGFNNPATENIRALVSDALGLQDVHLSWAWQNCTSAQAVQRLAGAMQLRHQIAHGVNPRPFVSTFYPS